MILVLRILLLGSLTRYPVWGTAFRNSASLRVPCSHFLSWFLHVYSGYSETPQSKGAGAHHLIFYGVHFRSLDVVGNI